MFKTQKIQKKPNMYETVIVESGSKIWDKKNGEIRKVILETVGPEYKQINLLAEVLAEIIKSDSNLQDDAVIANAMAKFEEINKLRKSK